MDALYQEPRFTESKGRYSQGTILYVQSCKRMDKFKSRPFVVISNLESMDDRRKYLCLEITSNFQQAESIPIQLDHAIGFVCAIPDFVFYDNELRNKMYYGSIEPTILEYLLYKRRLYEGYSRIPEVDEKIDEYCKRVLKMLLERRTILYRERSVIEAGGKPFDHIQDVYLGGKYRDAILDDLEPVNSEIISSDEYGLFLPDVQMEIDDEEYDDVISIPNGLVEGEYEIEEEPEQDAIEEGYKEIERQKQHKKDAPKSLSKIKDAYRRFRKGKMSLDAFESFCKEEGEDPNKYLKEGDVEVEEHEEEMVEEVDDSDERAEIYGTIVKAYQEGRIDEFIEFINSKNIPLEKEAQ